MNPNDTTRHQILCWFYERNLNATSQYGKKGSAVKISDVKKALKERHSFSQSQVMSNLTYLIDKGWINKHGVEKTVVVKGGTVPSVVVWYEISAEGIDKVEGESEFSENPRYAGINISAIGSNVITLGDGNVVNAEFADLHTELNKLKEAVVSSTEITDSQKWDVSADIESIKDQLAKAQPDKTVIGRLWTRIGQIATIGGFAAAMEHVAPLISGLIP